MPKKPESTLAVFSEKPAIPCSEDKKKGVNVCCD